MANQTMQRFGHPQTLIRDYANWVVLLRDQQVTLGSLVLAAKSEVTAFSALPPDAFVELAGVVTDIERALSAAVDYQKINYLMLMMVDPNVHFHVFPRYEGERSACGITLSDQGWPAAPQLKDARSLNAAERDALCSHLATFW